jgi:hypothetical protein
MKTFEVIYKIARILGAIGTWLLVLQGFGFLGG